MTKNRLIWDKRHGDILLEILQLFSENKIRYFIIRNYIGLPNNNSSKDVDIIIENGKIKQAIEILKLVYKNNDMTYFYKVQYEQGHNCKGMNISNNIAIHIDLMEGYFARGAEVFTFNELYSQTIIYNNFRVLNELYDGVMLFIYKQFGYRDPKLKQEYRTIIYDTHENNPEFRDLISELVGDKLTSKIFHEIEKQNFDRMLNYTPELTKALRRYAFKKNPVQTLKYTFAFYIEKFNRIVFNYRHFSKVFSVMAPDGAGKTTFLEALIEKINFYYVNDASDGRCHVYHFRPNLLPNLGALGEKTGVKAQDTDFTNPHRSKPAGKLSSFVRISYYWLDYILGFNLFVRKDVQYDKFSIFDRYSYDLIVDPLRTKLNLPAWLRSVFVKLMPHPAVVFYLSATPEVIFKRKQELTLEEITRQNIEYSKLVSSHPRFVALDSNRPVNESVDDALRLILDTFAEKL